MIKNADVPRFRLQDPQRQLQQRRFTTSIWPNHTGTDSFVDLKIDILEDEIFPVAEIDVLEAESRCHVKSKIRDLNATYRMVSLTNCEFENSKFKIVDDEYKVRLDIFEGPLDLLLYLIKKDEVDIYDISIERITTQYMAYLETFKLLNINLAGEFIVMASNLMYIKSRLMLPRHVQPPDEETEEDDPRWDLIRQLIEYKKFKDAAAYLGKREEQQTAYFHHLPEIPDTPAEETKPLGEVGIFDLIQAFQNVLQRFEESKGSFGEIQDDHWTVSDKISHLLDSIQPGKSVPFSRLFAAASSKGEVIVTFLALLELMKVNHFKAIQTETLGDIELHRNETA